MAGNLRSRAWRAVRRAEAVLRGGHAERTDQTHRARNFLFLQFESALGSVVHATPLFEALRLAVPEACIAVAASPIAAAALSHNPFIDRCQTLPNPCNHFITAVRAIRPLVASMPAEDLVILTTIGNQRTRIALLSVLAGKALRAGYTLAPELYQVALDFNPERGQIEGNLDILRRFGWTGDSPETRVFFSAEEVENAGSMLLPGIGETRIAFITQNSGGQPNRWSDERFTQTIDALCAPGETAPIFLGTAADRAAIDKLRARVANSGLNLAGQTTIPQLAAVLAQCDLAVSLDTGGFHVSRAAGLPGVVLAPAWQNPIEWLPVGNPGYRILRGDSIPSPPRNYWIEEISAGQAIEAARDLLARFPPSLEARKSRVRRSLAPLRQ
jgi:ADP-heptose:LPS heptosyltransferase